MPSDIFKTLDTISTSDKYNYWIYQGIREHITGKVLDVGSGLGDIAKHYIHSDIEEVILSDHSAEMVPYLKNKFSEYKKFHPIQFDILSDELENTIPLNSCHTVTCINVLEHIGDDVKALKNMESVLKKNGKLLLLVPALPQIYGTLDTLVGHCRRYTKNSMVEALKQTNFVIEEQKYMNFFGIITWFLAGKILKQKSFDKNTCQRLDKIVPFLENIEKLFKPPIGQSLITICRK